MFDVYIEKVNDVHIRIHATAGIREQIADVFKFRIPKYQFHPKYKAGIWDGYIKLFNPHTCLMHTGLLKELVKFCRRYSYSVFVDPKLMGYDSIEYADVEKWFHKTLRPTDSDGDLLDVRDYQLDAITKSLKFRRVLLESATNSGKSFVIYAILKWLFETEKIGGALIVVPTINLVHQMYADFDEYSANSDFSSEEWVHKIYAGQDKWTDKPISLATWQSIYKMEPEWFAQFDCIIGDEAHGCEAKSLVRIMEVMTKCPYKIGMTGSLSDFEGSLMNLQGLFGTHIKVIGAKEMIERGDSTPLNIWGVMLKYPDHECKEMSRVKREMAKANAAATQAGTAKPYSTGAEYSHEIEFLMNHGPRRKFIRNLATSRDGNTLVLFRFETHGKQIYDDIKASVPEDRPVFLIYGKVKGEVREAVRKVTDSHADAIIVASYGTFSTGINIKSLKHLILAFPYKSKIKIVQSLGRMLRLFVGKDAAMVWDICDDLQWKSQTNYAKDQFLDRLMIYRKEKHSYNLTEVKF